MDSKSVCGKEIKRIRSDLGFTQGGFARQVGVRSAAVISNYENGRRSPDRSFIRRVMSLAQSNAMMIDVNALLS